MSNRIAVCLVVAALGLAAAPTYAKEGEARTLEEIAVELAKTPQDHAALSNHYRDEAERARASMRRHRAMDRVYSSGKLGTRGGSVHCKKLAEHYEALAAEYDSLAKLHEAESKKAP